MSNNEIEVKLVLDQSQIRTTELSEDLMDDITQTVCDSYSLENAIDSYINNSELYYLPDTVGDIQHTLDEYDFDQMQDDLNRDEEAIDDIKGRLDTLEEEAGLDWRTEFGDRLDTIEDKLGTDWYEEDNREISRLQERVDKLEEINKRLFHIIHNIQGVSL